MAQAHTSSSFASSAQPAEALPEVCLEVTHGTSRSTVYAIAETGFIIGTVPGCDLRISGNDWPAVMCLVSRQPSGPCIRKLCPTQPVLVNGKAVTTSALIHGDKVQVGPVNFVVQVLKSSAASVKIFQGTTSTPTPKAEAVGAPELDKDRRQFQEQIAQFKEKVLRFEQDKQRIEAELLEQKQELDRQRKAMEENNAAQQKSSAEVGRTKTDPGASATPASEREAALAKREQEVVTQKKELAAARQELADIRTQLYDRYRERRDRLAGLQEAVNKAARKVQERKQALDAELRESELSIRKSAAKQAELDANAANLRQEHEKIEETRQQLQANAAELVEEKQRISDNSRQLEEKLAADRTALVQEEQRHKEDLLRFTRLRTELDDRTKQLEDRERELETRYQQLHADTSEMEGQVAQLDEWHVKLGAVAEKLGKQKAEQEQVSQQLAQRAAALEGQQAALAALRTRLERTREDIRQQEQQLAEQRTHQESAEAKLKQKQEDVEQLREQLEGEKTLLEQERRTMAERAGVLDTAVAQLREAQERLSVDEQRVREQTLAFDATKAEQAESTTLLQARIAQYDDLHKRLEAERENLRERSLLLAQAEQARETLQEQLRRRSEELSVRQKTMQEQVAKHDAEAASIQRQRDEIDAVQKQHLATLAVERSAVEQRAQEIQSQQKGLVNQTAALERTQSELSEKKKALAEEWREFVEQRAKLDIDKRAAEVAVQLARKELEDAKREALALRQQLPELELRAGTALERLTHGREQMRDHLDEVHTYAAQCREELEALRSQVQSEAQRLQEQEQGLHRGQEEQRLAIAAFRQQLIDWQGQITDMKRLMAHDENRLEQRQSQVAEQARQLGADSARLAQQAVVLKEKQRHVEHKSAEVERHLGDMRKWYRRKLRELAGINELDEKGGPVDSPDAPRRDILSLTGDVDPIDRKLGDLMRSLDLIDADSLTALLVEARRQRRSLRQTLLASGAVTLYQMALIEAGNLDGLMLGPVRVVDRLRAGPRETLYRVFDPRRGCEAVLRQLVESEAVNSDHAEEFRWRFAQALINHPNIAATLEVFDVAGRPAVLQESVAGLPSNDWPALAAVPGVWYRLLLQGAQALHAAHETGLIHGHLQPAHFVLTSDGILKVRGYGEPAWLVAGEVTSDETGDLKTLGEIAGSWCPAAQRKDQRGKALPSALLTILDRLTSPGEGRITSASTLLDELEAAAGVVPVNPEAWDRLLRHVKDSIVPVIIRQAG